jgi:hypothetical protein
MGFFFEERYGIAFIGGIGNEEIVDPYSGLTGASILCLC